MSNLIPDYYYSIVLIDKEGKQSQLPYFSINKEFYGKLKNHVVLAVLKINTKSKKIISIEQTPSLNNFSGYRPPIPISSSDKIWRYLEYYKFEDLIKSSSLYLSRIDQFKDNLEGVSPESCRNSIQVSNSFSPEKKVEQIQLFEKRTQYNRKSSFVCCWHINKGINKDMWNLYGKCSSESVAIETSVIQLEKSTKNCPVPFVFETIRYYEEPFFNQETYWFPSLFKIKEFEFEREYRSAIYIHNSTDSKALKIPINLKMLITRIHLHPNSSELHRSKITKLIKTNGLKIPINLSLNK